MSVAQRFANRIMQYLGGNKRNAPRIVNVETKKQQNSYDCGMCGYETCFVVLIEVMPILSDTGAVMVFTSVLLSVLIRGIRLRTRQESNRSDRCGPKHEGKSQRIHGHDSQCPRISRRFEKIG